MIQETRRIKKRINNYYTTEIQKKQDNLLVYK